MELWKLEKLDVSISGSRSSKPPKFMDRRMFINGRSDHKRGTTRRRNNDLISPVGNTAS
uniref:Uncharacterized protein n=1 Tax=Solanum lycopersicum TaxID=4081 RepID=A0A3Q7JW52_SOLLC